MYRFIADKEHPHDWNKANAILITTGTLISVTLKDDIIVDGIIIDSIENCENSEITKIQVELFISHSQTIKLKLRLDQFKVRIPAQKIFIPNLIIPSNKLFENLHSIKEVDEEIMRFLKNKPEHLNSIHPAAFEDLIRKIYLELNYEVEPVGNWNQADGGVDIFALKKTSEFGQLKFAIQCKRSKNKIQSKIIRELNGVLEHNKCNFGIVATSSYFTKDAIELSTNDLWKIKLNDRDKILENLEQIFK